MVAFFGYPVVKNLLMSFQDYTTADVLHRRGARGSARQLPRGGHVLCVRKAMLNTVLFTAGSIAGQFVIGLALALFFRRRFPLSGVLRSLLLLPWLIPLIVSSAVWRWILDQDNGALNRFLAAAPDRRPVPAG
jgi:multiple sugar transport system permease protein